MKYSSFTPIAGAVAVVLVLGGIGYVMMRDNDDAPRNVAQVDPSNFANPTPTTTPIPSAAPMKEHAGKEFTFSYPNILSVRDSEGTSRLTHSVPYSHKNPCDAKGTGRMLENIVDFDVSMKLYHLGLADTVKETESSTLIHDAFAQGAPALSPGFIDAYSAGSLSGYQVTSGIEGCGRFTYYFRVSPGKTLFVSRPFVTEFNPIIADFQTYLAVPGIIDPERAEKIFTDLLASLTFSS